MVVNEVAKTLSRPYTDPLFKIHKRCSRHMAVDSSLCSLFPNIIRSNAVIKVEEVQRKLRSGASEASEVRKLPKARSALSALPAGSLTVVTKGH